MTGEPLFTFAIIADTHVNPADGQSGSPWPSNALANARMRWAIAALNHDAPAFVVHMGDMVHPIPQQPDYQAAVERFRSISSDLQAPLHCIPGNHDLGDKPADWMPAHPVTAASVTTYDASFGPLWQAFDHGDCRFVLHCNPLLGSGLPEDEHQWQWLEAELQAAHGRRIFFFTHYPLFLTDPDEPEHYDNLAPAARERLRAMLEDAGVEAVFAAHVHNVFHTRLGKKDDAPFQHVVPTLSALRLDYSHLFKAPPLKGMENGRNDAAKLGYYLIDVRREGYGIRFRRSHGLALVEGAAAPSIPALPRREIAGRAVGVDLRQGWAEPRIIPYTGVVDEFRRKSARNDWLISALQEAGIRDLRVPVDDLADPVASKRMRDLAAFGHRFHLFAIEPPAAGVAEALEAAAMIARIEVVARTELLPGLLVQWRMAADGAGADLLASKLWTSADLAEYGASFSHFIGHGFTSRDADAVRSLTVDGAADGVVFRLSPGEAPAETIAGLPFAEAGKDAVYVTLCADNPAHEVSDDGVQAERVRRVLEGAATLDPRPVVIFDTLEDLDRGYYPRHGIYDMRFNPRPAADVLAHS